MAASPPPPPRARPGSIERPVNARLYRGTWLLVGIPLLVAAFSVSKPEALRPSEPRLPPGFDKTSAVGFARDLSRLFPGRFPGSSGAEGAADWIEAQFASYGFRVRHDRFTATIPGRGRVRLDNLIALVPGRSPEALVVLAHRDDAGTGPGANDNASGVAALLELARSYATTTAIGGAARAPLPAHTILLVATDGGAFGGLGAERFARTYRGRVVAVISLDSVAGSGKPRLVITGNAPRSPAATLVETAAARIAEQTSVRPARTSALGQLIDLGFPFSLYEQATLVARGIPAITLTTVGARPPPAFSDSAARLNGRHLVQIGRATQEILRSLDPGVELAQGTTSYVYFGPRIIRGWAIQLVLIAMLLPVLITVVDLFARCRRRRVPLAPAFRSYRTRLAFWLWVGLVFGLFSLLGAWAKGADLPLSPETRAAGHWPALGLVGVAALAGLGWLVARDRLVPRRSVAGAETLAGYTAALLALGVIAVVVVAMNPFALIFILPSLHAWLWMPQVRARPLWARWVALALGFSGPLLLVGSFALRYHLGFDAPWYLTELVAVGYVGWGPVIASLAWMAVAAQLAALSAGRYAPYPTARERPRLGPIRSVIRHVARGVRARRRAAEAERHASEG
jgi:hypothetical protein